MNIQAVIFDIYGTLLEVGPPPADAQARWDLMWQDRLKAEPRRTLSEFSGECDRVIAREHAAARGLGIPFPEVYWPAVVNEVLPELARLAEAERSEFLFDQAQLWHTVSLMPGVAPVLTALANSHCRLGLASNSQPYTLREMDSLLAAAGLRRSIFTSDLCFFSFACGFSKPDPHVFRLLTARLRALGISPGATLMIGDRLDHDIEPARAHGWQTWQLSASPTEDGKAAGDWDQLAHHWRNQTTP